MTKNAYQKESEAALGYPLDPKPNEKLELNFPNWGALGPNGATSMYNTLNHYKELTELDVSKLDISKLTNMGYMFANYCELTNLDLSNWDTSKVTNMGSMFIGCESLTNLDVSKFDTSKVTDMYNMFAECYELTNLDVSRRDTSSVTDMDNMFSVYFREMKLTTITGVIDMKSCTSYNNMFHNCTKLTGVKIKNPPSGFNGGGLSSSQYTIVS